ncbi:MAG: hypothetical protein WDZ35_10005 [Crocinitomicaceae bacterium]
MKKSLLILLSLISCQFIYSQSYFLKNYKAPDFKFRLLSTQLGGKGFGIGASESYSSQLSSGLNFYQISNNKKYQGTYRANYNLSFSHRKDTINGQTAVMNNSLANITSNRFYLRELLFVGVHDFSHIALQNSGQSDQYASNSLAIFLNPVVSVGYGRVEYVRFARRAMDIDRMFRKRDISQSPMSEEMLRGVADKITEISNKRYFDRRLGYIDQLELLDAYLQEIGYDSDRDIRYFSQLMDSYLFANQMFRRSGFRMEAGVYNGLSFGYQSNGPVTFSEFTRNRTFGFLDMTYNLPVNYALQSDIHVSVLGGLNANLLADTKRYPIWFDAEYTLGWFPNTRTEWYNSASAGVYNEDNAFGYKLGVRSDLYYYFTPRFRLKASASMRYGYYYSQSGFFILGISNSSYIGPGISYNFEFGFSYAIF